MEENLLDISRNKQKRSIICFIFAMQNKIYSMLDLFKTYLSSKEVRIKQRDDSSITFDYKNLHYLFIVDNEDPYYFRMIIPNIIKPKQKKEEELLPIINSINIEYKVAKLVLLEDKNVWISAEQFLYSVENSSKLFERIQFLLESVFNKFKEEVSK